MKIMLQPSFDDTVSEAIVPTGDGRYHHLRVVRDGARAEEVYAFLWITTAGEETPIEWDEHWRGNLRACLRNYVEVTEDLVVEAFSALGAKHDPVPVG